MTHRSDTVDIHTAAPRHVDNVRLSVDGELDTGNAARFAHAGTQALDGRNGTTLIIDMADVTFIDAAGLGALVTIRTAAAANDNRVLVVRPSRCVVRLLGLTALAGSFGLGTTGG